VLQLVSDGRDLREYHLTAVDLDAHVAAATGRSHELHPPAKPFGQDRVIDVHVDVRRLDGRGKRAERRRSIDAVGEDAADVAIERAHVGLCLLRRYAVRERQQ